MSRLCQFRTLHSVRTAFRNVCKGTKKIFKQIKPERINIQQAFVKRNDKGGLTRQRKIDEVGA